jgi:hypothetical protein
MTSQLEPPHRRAVFFDGPVGDGTYFVPWAHLCQPCRDTRDVWAHRWNMGGTARTAAGENAPNPCDSCVEACKARAFQRAAREAR